MKIYYSYQEFLNLEEQWNPLVKNSTFPNVFLTWEWLSIWIESFKKNDRLYAVVFFDGPALVAAVPLYESRMSLTKGLTNVSSLCLIGDGAVVSPDYLGPIVKKEYVDDVANSLACHFGEVFQGIGVISLNSLNIRSVATSRLIEKLSAVYKVTVTQGESCPTLALPDSYNSFLSGLSNKRRKRISYELRRAEKEFSVTFRCFKDVADIDYICAVISNIYTGSAKSRLVKNGFANEHYADFHSKIMKAFVGKDWLRFYALYFDDEPVAYIYGYSFNQVFWFYQTAYIEEHNKYAPGSILLQMVIENSIKEGLTEFDFLRGDEAYKYRYNSGERELSNVSVFRKNNFLYLTHSALRWVSQYFNKLAKD